MSSRPLRLSLFAAILALVLLALASSASASGRQAYPAKLHVAGGLTITTKHDFTGSCEPGQAWTIEAQVEVEVNGTIQIERIGKRIVQSTDAKSPGGAANKNVLSEYHESNYCPPEDPVELGRKPECGSHTGTGSASLLPDGRNKAPWLVAIGISRRNGGDQHSSCSGGSVIGPTPRGSQIEALQSSFESIVLPLDLKVSQFKSLGVGKKLIRRVNVGGSCDSAVVYGGAHISVFRDDVCEIDGVFNVEIKRLKGPGRSGFTTAGAFAAG
ncbi:MAG: hypothetical protein JJE35_03090 [Thermoleophilia bacterium]|nr:hypothetical protein [Thermoleophilia bacterium]